MLECVHLNSNIKGCILGHTDHIAYCLRVTSVAQICKFQHLRLSLLICFTFMSCDCVPADTLHPYSSKKFLCLSLSLSLSAPLTPPSPFTVKVILIKSSRRTELLIAPRRSSWFQIQIKAHRLFQKSSFPCPAFLHRPLHLCSTMLSTI